MLGDDDIDGQLDSLLQRHDEELYGDDAIWQMNFKQYLEQFFRHVAATHHDLATQLNAEEVAILKAILI